jgi:predicted metal-binding membrane protein
VRRDRTAVTAAPQVLATERRVVLWVLLSLAAVGWGVVVWQAAVMDSGPEMGMDTGVDLTMGMAAPLFLAMWIAMMVAMMFPASAPMIVMFARSQSRRRAEGDDFVPTWLFVAPYLAVWLAFGVLGYLAAVAVDAVADDSMWATDNLPRIAGGLLVVAGVYQLTPLKRVCLSRCRSPLSFVMSYWRNGRSGAVRMGLRHGLYCLGCCWVLFVILLPIGVMNVAAMLAIAALVFAEKVVPAGERVAAVAAVVLIGYGLLALVVPDALPTVA